MKRTTTLFLLSLFVAAASAQVRYANNVIAYSSHYGTPGFWGADQALGAPDTYPSYGDLTTAWASASADTQREYLVLGYSDPAPVGSIAIFETFNPGAVDTIYLRNAATGAWQKVFSMTASGTGLNGARINVVNIPVTPYNVNAVRLALNSPAVPGWNEVDAVAIAPSAIDPNTGEVGITEADRAAVNIYPNPATDRVHITLGSAPQGRVQLDVFDATGNQVMAQGLSNRPEGQLTVSTTELAGGLYFFRLGFADGSSSAFRVCVRH